MPRHLRYATTSMCSTASSAARFETHDRLLLAAARRLLSRSRWEVFAVRPETLLRWHRRLVTRKATKWGSRSRGRPPIPLDLKVLIVRLAKDNSR